MDESTSPAQCSAIAQLQVSIKRVISPSDVRASQKVGCYVRRDPMRVAVLAASVKMRIVNYAGGWPMFCMFWCWPGRSEGDTVDASDDDDADWLIYRGRRWCPWLIREFLSLCISISLLRPYTFFSRSPLVFKTLFENTCELQWVVLYLKESR